MKILITIKASLLILFIILTGVVYGQSDYDIASEQAKIKKAEEVAYGEEIDCKIIKGIILCKESNKEMKELVKELKK